MTQLIATFLWLMSLCGAPVSQVDCPPDGAPGCDTELPAQPPPPVRRIPSISNGF
jgi:hypothetical protein